MQLFYSKNIEGDHFHLEAQESNHLIKVLRKGLGDKVKFTDGSGFLYDCVIHDANPKKAKIAISTRHYTPEDDFYIHLAVCPTKNTERIEWMLEKITEIGVHEISLIESEHSERATVNMERLWKKVVSAGKQSLKTRFPKVNPLIRLEDLVADHRYDSHSCFVAYLSEENDRHLFEQAQANKAYLILIGPEGDFSRQELELAFKYHFRPCSLGKSRLRTETAGLVAVHTLQLVNALP